MNPPKAVIASTGRSGSGYIYKVLEAYGIDAGHESYFCFPWKRPQGCEIDSSWIATDQLSDYDGIVFHQVRHPLKVITSLMATSKEKPTSKVWGIRERMMPYRTGERMRDFMAMICSMNEEIEKHTNLRYRIEEFDAVTLDWMILSIGNIATYDDYMRGVKAIQSVSKDYNSHHDNDYLSWDEIEDSKEKEMLMKQAQKYGYE